MPEPKQVGLPPVSLPTFYTIPSALRGIHSPNTYPHIRPAEVAVMLLWPAYLSFYSLTLLPIQASASGMRYAALRETSLPQKPSLRFFVP